MQKSNSNIGNIVIRGREFTPSEIALIEENVSSHLELSRRKLSLLISERLNWRQPNGYLKDRACRDVLLRLNKKGIIKLPEPRLDFKTQTAGVKDIDFQEPCYPITGKVNDYSAPILHVVQNSKQWNLWNYLIEHYHYKGCRITVNRYLKYFT